MECRFNVQQLQRIFFIIIQYQGQQDGRVVKTSAFGSEGPWFNPRQQPLTCGWHSGDSNGHNSHTSLVHDVHFHYLPPRLSDESFNQSPESIA